MGATLQEQLERAEARQRLEESRLATAQAKLQRHAIEARQKQLATYDGAKHDRRDEGWKRTNHRADDAILPDLPALIARARAMVRDSPYGRSIIRAYRRNVVGRGITPTPAARFGSGRSRKQFNARAAEIWKAWAENSNAADMEGRKTFYAFQRMAAAHLVEVGEILVVLSNADNGPDLPPLRLQAIEPEQLDTSIEKAPNGRKVKGGVEVDGFGRATAYWIQTDAPLALIPDPTRPGDGPAGSARNPADRTGNTRTGRGRRASRAARIPADRVLHIMDQERVAQVRGVSWFAPVLRKMRDLAEYDQLELWSARMQACLAIGIERPGGPGSGNAKIGQAVSGDDEQDAAGNREITWDNGIFFESNPGEKLHLYSPNRPAGHYEPFTRSQARLIGAGLGLSGEQVLRDFTGGNFSSQRQGLLEDRREWRMVQAALILDLCQPVYNELVTLAVMAQLIPTADAFFQNRTAYLACTWAPDAWEWIDPAKQAAADKIMREGRVDTRERQLAERGLAVENVLRQIADERTMADDLGITLPEDQAATTPGAPPGEPRPRGEDEPPEANDDQTADPIGAAVVRDALADEPAAVVDAVLE